MEENELEKLENKLDLAAEACWQEYFSQNGEQDNTIVWLRNDTTGRCCALPKDTIQTSFQALSTG